MKAISKLFKVHFVTPWSMFPESLTHVLGVLVWSNRAKRWRGQWYVGVGIWFAGVVLEITFRDPFASMGTVAAATKTTIANGAGGNARDRRRFRRQQGMYASGD